MEGTDKRKNSDTSIVTAKISHQLREAMHGARIVFCAVKFEIEIVACMRKRIERGGKLTAVG